MYFSILMSKLWLFLKSTWQKWSYQLFSQKSIQNTVLWPWIWSRFYKLLLIARWSSLHFPFRIQAFFDQKFPKLSTKFSKTEKNCKTTIYEIPPSPFNRSKKHQKSLELNSKINNFQFTQNIQNFTRPIFEILIRMNFQIKCTLNELKTFECMICHSEFTDLVLSWPTASSSNITGKLLSCSNRIILGNSIYQVKSFQIKIWFLKKFVILHQCLEFVSKILHNCLILHIFNNHYIKFWFWMSKNREKSKGD